MTLYQFLRKRHIEDLASLRLLERELPDNSLKFSVRSLRRDIQLSLALVRKGRDMMQ